MTKRHSPDDVLIFHRVITAQARTAVFFASPVSRGSRLRGDDAEIVAFTGVLARNLLAE